MYEYICGDCGTAFEKFVRYPDKDVVQCPLCGHENLIRQISTFGFPIPGRVKPVYKGPHKEDFKPHDHDD